MRTLFCAFLVLTGSGQAQVPDPPWLTALQSIQQEIEQAPLNSLDQKVDQAWQSALQMPRHPFFEMAAQITTNYYVSNGYDLKAEQILRQALTAMAETDVETRRNLTSLLAGHFEDTRQLLKALAIREQLARLPSLAAADPDPAKHEAAALAGLHERMGEFEKAEAAWKVVTELRVAQAPRKASGFGGVADAAPYSLGYPRGRQDELANFYARRGRSAEAELIYKAALTEAAQSNSPDAWIGAADSYISFLSQQRRYDETMELIRQSIAVIEDLPDPHTTSMRLFRHQQMAAILDQASRTEEALDVRKQAVETVQARSPGSPEHVGALESLARALLGQNRLEDAEEAVSRMRAAASEGSQPYFESIALQLLVLIRDMQNRHEEGGQIRSSLGIPDFAAVGSNNQVELQVALDAADAVADRVAALTAEGLRMAPSEVAWLMNVAHALMSHQQEEAARRSAVKTLRLLDQAPDHPRVAEVLGSAVSPLLILGMPADAERTIERQQGILISAKGVESPALNSVGSARIALLRHDSNWLGVVDEYQRMLVRTEQATGPKSRASLFALRELAWAYPSANNWPDEERVLLTLLDRTANLLGPSSLDYAQLREQMANRAAGNREFDKALDWMDQAIEITGNLPQAGLQLAGMTQERVYIEQSKAAALETSSQAPFVSPASPGDKWFDADRFQRTDGARLGNRLGGEFLSGSPPDPPPAASPAPPPAKH